MKVYSLTARPGDPRYLQVLRADYWFWQRGYEVVPFNMLELHDGMLDRDLREEAERTIVFGSVGAVLSALRRAGRSTPANVDFPDELQEFLGREVRFATMGDVRGWEREGSARLPLHVKPRDRQKLFTGMMVAAFRDLIATANVRDEEPVIVQEPVAMRSEWRASILRGEILHVGNYRGDPLVFPDPAVMKSAVERYESAPIGYGMDWAVTDEGRTLLVEVNDGFALGNYGVPGHQYTALIECRWRQLMGLEDNGVGYLF